MAEDILIVLRKELLAVRSAMLGVAIMLVFWLARTSETVGDLVTPANARTTIPLLAGQAATWWAGMASFSVFYALNAELLVRDRETKTTEALLTTPLALAAIWLGKSLYMWFVAMASMIVVVAFAMIRLNAVRPDGMAAVLPDAAATVFLVLLWPIFLLTVILLLSLALLMAWNVFVIYAGLVLGMILPIYWTTTSRASSIVPLAWRQNAALGVTIIVLTTLVLLTRRFLSAERVVLRR